MENLHRKLSEMGQRITQLEDALAILQSSFSTEPHALLADELLSIKIVPVAPTSNVATKNTLSETIDAFGTLTIDDSGEAKYFGRSAGSEVHQQNPKMLKSHLYTALRCFWLYKRPS